MMTRLVVDSGIATLMVRRAKKKNIEHGHAHVKTSVWMHKKGSAELAVLASFPTTWLECNGTPNSTQGVSSRFSEVRGNQTKAN